MAYGDGYAGGYGAGRSTVSAAMVLRRRAMAIPVVAGPDTISGLSLWLRADGTLWQDSARTTPATADGHKVGAWDDASGNARHVVQATSANRPTLKTAIVNGKPVVRFAGSPEFLSSGAAQYVGVDGTWTVFAVAATTGGSYPQNIVDHDDAASNRVAQLLRYSASNTVQSIAFNTDPAAFTDSVTAASGFDLVEAVRDASSVEALLNGSGNGATTTTGTPKTSSAAGVAVGKTLGSLAQYLVGDVAEIVLFNRALTAGERTTVRTHLTGRFGSLA